MIKNLGIRGKLNLFTVLLVGVVSLFVAIVVLYQNYQGRLEDLHAQSVADATLLQRTLLDPLRLDDDFMVYQLITAASKSLGSGTVNALQFIVLLDDAGKVLSSSSPALLPMNSSFEQNRHEFKLIGNSLSILETDSRPQLHKLSGSREFYVLAPVGEYGVKYANLLLHYSTKPLIDSFAKNTVEILFIIIVISMVLMIFSQLILRQLLHPFKALNEKMLAMSARHNLNINKDGNSGDEIKQLEDTYQQMEIQLKALEESRDRAEEDLRNMNVELELRVQHRTAEVEIARDEAERASNAKSDFLSSMSHELRTPMNGILGFSQVLKYDETLSELHKESVEEIISAGEHLLALINEVLDLAKIESGRIDLSLEPVDLNHVFKECMKLISVMATNRKISVTHSDLNGIVVRADRTRLKQILINLLSNAVKYNRDGGSVHLYTKVTETGRIQVLVSDTGKGISAENLKSLFVPFNRLDAEMSNIEGTGIGLTITRRIIELMGGSVDVDSTPGSGSIFWIELPVDSMPETANSGETIQTLKAEHEGKYLVLYIEDNPSNLRLMSKILGQRKHIHLLTAHTPDLGIELANARHPDLILLDVNMQGLDGYQVLSIFKANEDLRNIPVIAVTANAMPRDIEKGKKAGFNDYLVKPVEVTRLYGLLDEYLKLDEIDQ